MSVLYVNKSWGLCTRKSTLWRSIFFSELITNFEFLKLSYECQNTVGCFPFTSLYGATLWSLRMRAFSVSQPQPAGKPEWLEEPWRVGGNSCWFRGTQNHHSRFASHVTSVWRVSEQKVLSRLLQLAVVADSYRCIVHTGWESRREGLRSQSGPGQQRQMRILKF